MKALLPAGTLFGPSAATTTQVKVALFRRVGEALGVDRADFDTDRGWTTAVRAAFSQLKQRDGGAAAIAEIEHDLGLDAMGVSLETVVGAMANGGDDDQRLDQAIAEAGRAGGPRHASALTLDEIGTYRSASRALQQAGPVI